MQNFLQHYLSILHNYSDSPIKLFSDLNLAKFLDTSAKLFFPCKINVQLNKQFYSYYNSKIFNCVDINFTHKIYIFVILVFIYIVATIFFSECRKLLEIRFYS